MQRVAGGHVLELQQQRASVDLHDVPDGRALRIGDPEFRGGNQRCCAGHACVSNHSSSTWCRKIFEIQGETTPPCGVPSVVRRKRPSSTTPAFSHLSIIRRMTPSLTRWSRNARRWVCDIESKEDTTDYPSPGSPQISSGYARAAPI